MTLAADRLKIALELRELSLIAVRFTPGRRRDNVVNDP
jgi:hypothetical protein